MTGPDTVFDAHDQWLGFKGIRHRDRPFEQCFSSMLTLRTTRQATAVKGGIACKEAVMTEILAVRIITLALGGSSSRLQRWNRTQVQAEVPRTPCSAQDPAAKSQVDEH
jgi:hypothetical protein